MDPITSMRQEITAFEQAAAKNSKAPNEISELATKCLESIQQAEDSITPNPFSVEFLQGLQSHAPKASLPNC